LYNREDYPELYAIMPAALIEDEDTFHTPDLSDRTIVGAGNTFDALVTGGELAVTLFEDHLPAHQHSLPAHDHGYDQPSGITFNDGTGAVRETALIQAGLTTQAGGVSNATGADEPHENMPPFMAFYMWIVATV
jgi:microcystin-dependent protein